MRQHVCFILACALTACGFTTAQAEEAVTASARVNSEGLDLSTSAGADRFLKRLSIAAGRVCIDRRTLITAGVGRDFQICRAKAMAKAVADSRSPVIQQRFAASSKAKVLHLVER